MNRRSLELGGVFACVILAGLGIGHALQSIFGARSDSITDSRSIEMVTEERAIYLSENIDYRWNLRNLDGSEVDFGDFRNEVVLVNIWATWCGPCVQEMPSLQRVHRQMEGRVKFIFASDEDPEAIRRFLVRNSLDLPIYIFKDLPPYFNVTAIPATFIIGRGGKIELSHLGNRDWDRPEMIDLLKKLVDQK